MILLCGIPSETPLQLVAEALKTAGASFTMFNQRHVADCRIEFDVQAGSVTGQLKLRNDIWPLEDFTSIYSRLMDDRSLPELNGLTLDSPEAVHCRQFHERLMHWIDISSACVVNRSAAIATNLSKPYQAQLIQNQGFLIPETLITNNPDLVREFHAKHAKVIYKSISATRSIVETLSDSDFDRIKDIHWCPVQFQEFIEGVNVRVHVTGDEVYATAVSTEATDYRYAMEQSGEPAQLREVELSQELADCCVNLTRSLSLVISGIDLKIAPNDDVYCLEVNPCPAFSYYECSTGQPISAGVARCLMNPCANGLR